MVTPHVPPSDSRAIADVAEARLPDLLESYRSLVRARALEARWGELEQKGAVMPRRAAAGEEAAMAGAGFALGSEDWVLGEGTEVVLALSRGATLSEFVANAFGRGPNPWNVRERRTLASDLRNGAHVTQGVGVAWGAKIERRPAVVLVTFGEELTATGEFHNGVNFAGVFKAPAIFLTVTRARTSSGDPENGERPADWGSAYGISSQVCDGADFFAVAQTVGEARRHALAGLGPTLIEARLASGQGAGDAVMALRRHLEPRGLFDAEHEARVESAASAELDRALTKFGAVAIASYAASLAPESRIVVPTGRRPG